MEGRVTLVFAVLCIVCLLVAGLVYMPEVMAVMGVISIVVWAFVRVLKFFMDGD